MYEKKSSASADRDKGYGCVSASRDKGYGYASAGSWLSVRASVQLGASVKHDCKRQGANAAAVMHAKR